MQFFHLSNNSFDGFCAFSITYEYFEKGYFYQPRQGDNILTLLSLIFSDMKKTADDDLFFIVTGLSLNHKEASFIESSIEALSEDKEIEIILLTTKECDDNKRNGYDYHWYYTKEEGSISNFLYLYLNDNFELPASLYIEQLLDLIEENRNSSSKFATILVNLLESAKEIDHDFLIRETINYKLYLMRQAITRYYKKENGAIELEESEVLLKKGFFSTKNGQTLFESIGCYLYEAFNDKREQMAISYKQKKGILLVESVDFYDLAQKLLEKNADIQFITHIEKSGKISFWTRPDTMLNAEVLAVEIANGGGDRFKGEGILDVDFETLEYQEIREKVKNIFKEREMTTLS